MLTDEQLEIIADAIAPLFQYLEQEVIYDIARRIKNTMSYTRTAELQAMDMAKLGYSPAKIRFEAMRILHADSAYRKAVAKNTMEYKREVRDLINSITKQASIENNSIVAQAGHMSWISDLAIWKEAGKELTENGRLSELVNAFAEQTAGELKNLTGTSGFKMMSGYESIMNAYRNELDKAVIKVCTGTFDQNRVLKDTVHDLAKSGLRSIDFANGYSMQLDTAARVAIRTGCHQLSAEIHNENIKQTGENLVYVSEHWGARNTGVGVANHEEWQGQVYSITPGTDYTEEAHRIGQDRIMDLWYSTGYSVDGTHVNNPLGLYGYNCRHSHYVWWEGISELPKDNPEPRPKEINGKTYDYFGMTQRMRGMERNIRALKRERDACKRLDLPTDELDARIEKKTREYKDFCNECGVPEQTTKLRYESGSSDIHKTNAYKSYKNMMNKSNERGIISVKKSTLRGIPNTITQIENKKGGISRNYYDKDGKWIKQITNNDHGYPSKHPYGSKGEHAHDNIWEDGKIVGRPIRELTELERKENSDILWEEKN